MQRAALDRTILKLSGDTVRPWLEGLITNRVSDGLTFAALLTPQGKIIADFFVHAETQNHLLIETPSKFGAALHKRLKLYKLREKIEIEDVSDTHTVYAVWGDEDPDTVLPDFLADPRLPALGYRHIQAGRDSAQDDYRAHRLSLGIPDSADDFDTVTTFPADANMDLLSGVDFKKGCFIGQEVVSRMKRMTTVKKRMRGLIFDGPAAAGDNILCGERVTGTVLFAGGNMGMGLIRLDRLRSAVIGPAVNGKTVQIMDGPDGL